MVGLELPTSESSTDSWLQPPIMSTWSHESWAFPGQGRHMVFASSPNLTTPHHFNHIPAGAPSLGQDTHDSHVWYHNGAPAACTLVRLDYPLPTFAKLVDPDLFVSRPNFKTNIGTFGFTGRARSARPSSGIFRVLLSPRQTYIELYEYHQQHKSLKLRGRASDEVCKLNRLGR